MEYLQTQKKVVPLHRFRKQSFLKKFGKVVEWSITAVLKTAVLRGTGGSNPSLSALGENKKSCKDFLCRIFCFLYLEFLQNSSCCLVIIICFREDNLLLF